MKHILKTLKEYRTRAGYKHLVIAEVIGKKRSTYSKKEKGDSPITIQELFKIAEFLDIPEAELFLKNNPEESMVAEKMSIYSGGGVQAPVLSREECERQLPGFELGGDPLISAEHQVADTADPQAFYAIAKGHEMRTSEIKDNDRLLVEPTRPPREGGLVLTLEKGRKLAIKKYYEEGDDIVLISPWEALERPKRHKKGEITVYRISECKKKL